MGRRRAAKPDAAQPCRRRLILKCWEGTFEADKNLVAASFASLTPLFGSRKSCQVQA
jgi:hypothetical protein